MNKRISMTLRSYFELHNKCKLLFKEIQVTYFQVSLINFWGLIQYKMTFEFWCKNPCWFINQVHFAWESVNCLFIAPRTAWTFWSSWVVICLKKSRLCPSILSAIRIRHLPEWTHVLRNLLCAEINCQSFRHGNVVSRTLMYSYSTHIGLLLVV